MDIPPTPTPDIPPKFDALPDFDDIPFDLYHDDALTLDYATEPATVHESGRLRSWFEARKIQKETFYTELGRRFSELSGVTIVELPLDEPAEPVDLKPRGLRQKRDKARMLDLADEAKRSNTALGQYAGMRRGIENGRRNGKLDWRVKSSDRHHGTKLAWLTDEERLQPQEVSIGERKEADYLDRLTRKAKKIAGKADPVISRTIRGTTERYLSADDVDWEEKLDVDNIIGLREQVEEGALTRIDDDLNSVLESFAIDGRTTEDPIAEHASELLEFQSHVHKLIIEERNRLSAKGWETSEELEELKEDEKRSLIELSEFEVQLSRVRDGQEAKLKKARKMIETRENLFNIAKAELLRTMLPEYLGLDMNDYVRLIPEDRKAQLHNLLVEKTPDELRAIQEEKNERVRREEAAREEAARIAAEKVAAKERKQAEKERKQAEYEASPQNTNIWGV